MRGIFCRTGLFGFASLTLHRLAHRVGGTMFGALRAFVAHELGNPSCVVASLSRTTSLISGFAQRGSDGLNDSNPPSKHTLAFHSDLQANPTRISPPGFPTLRNGSPRVDRNSGPFGQELGQFDRGGLVKATHRNLSGNGGKSGNGRPASGGAESKKNTEGGEPSGGREFGGEGGGSGGRNEAEGKNFEQRLNAKMVDIIERQLTARTEALKGLAKKRAGLEKLQNNSQHPVMVYSSSLLWADDAFGAFFTAMNKGLSWAQARMIRSFVDETFSESEFLEGCKDANHMVNQLFGQHDWESLKPMVSEKLGEAFRAVGDEFKKQGLSFSMTTEYVKDAFIQGFHICESHSLYRFDSSLFKDDNREDMGQYWLLVAVRMLTKERFKVSNEGGQMISDTLHQRSDLWTFARGPFTGLPVDKQDVRDTEWTLLSVS